MLLKGAVTPNIFLFIVNPMSSLLLAFMVKKTTESQIYPIIVFVIDCFTPVLGFLGLFIFYGLKPMMAFISVEDGEEDFYLPLGEQSYKRFEIQKKVELDNTTIQHRKTMVFERYNVEPLLEILLGDYELALKINAIEKLSNISNRSAISLLQKALEQEDYEVRYFANGALQKIEQKFLDEIDHFSDRIMEYPEKPSYYTERGNKFLEVHRLGLLDQSIENIFLEKALVDFMTSLSLDSGQSYLYTRIIEVNLRLGNLTDLVTLANIAMKSNILESEKAKILFYQAEACFQLGDYRSSQEYCKQSADLPQEFNLIKNCLSWWNEPA
ncbi:MAG: HEAT repeat domain-containing protein [Bacteriovoracaceae bacterium]|nr:HEAT repeat domain-containing protein [Bacteriovoracaceae bacterium]